MQLYHFTTDGQKLMLISEGSSHDNGWYDSMASRQLTALIPAKKGSKIVPYVHTNTAGVQMNITMYWIRLIQGHAS